MFLPIIALTVLSVLLMIGGLIYRTREPNRVLRIALPSLLAVGVIVAIVLSRWVRYQPEPTVRITGIPVPVWIETLQNGQWTGTPAPGLFVNLLLVPGLLASPLAGAILLRAIRREYPQP